MIDRDELRELLWTNERIRRAYPQPHDRHALVDRILALDRQYRLSVHP